MYITSTFLNNYKKKMSMEVDSQRRSRFLVDSEQKKFGLNSLDLMYLNLAVRISRIGM